MDRPDYADYYRLLYLSGTHFDWGDAMREDLLIKPIAQLTPQELALYATYIVRAERFNEGTFSAAVRSGRAPELYQRVLEQAHAAFITA